MKRNFKMQVVQMPGQGAPQSDPNTVDGEVVGGESQDSELNRSDDIVKPKAIKSGELLP